MNRNIWDGQEGRHEGRVVGSIYQLEKSIPALLLSGHNYSSPPTPSPHNWSEL